MYKKRKYSLVNLSDFDLDLFPDRYKFIVRTLYLSSEFNISDF